MILLAALLAGFQPEGASSRELLEELRSYPHRLVRESNRDGQFDLYLSDADGSHEMNLTRTPEIDELYPKASPDGKWISFEADEGPVDRRSRNIYVMKLDGTGRRKIADHSRDPCWSADGKRLAYLGDEFESLNLAAWATKGLFVHDLETGKTQPHPNRKIEHLYTLCWSPDGKWFIATVHGGLGFDHKIVAIEAEGEGVVDLGLPGCRPDVTEDGKTIAWGYGDFALGAADLEFGAREVRAVHLRKIVESRVPQMTYHVDWSPDGRYVAFSLGPPRPGKNLKGLFAQCPGIEAPGWNLCVADARGPNRWAALTVDGKSNKEPDWVPVRK
jgi:Tol biopolymer transport system component